MTHEAPSSMQRSRRVMPQRGGPARRQDDPRQHDERRGGPTSCSEALEAVIALAQATLSEPWAEGERIIPEQAAGSSAAPAARRGPAPTAKPVALSAQQQLALALRSLEPELALKVRTLMVAGRDGQSIHAVKIHMTLADGASLFHAAANDTSENGPLLADYLRRGHALAQASGLDLERPIAGWSSAERSRDEREWQRFGRQLAQSHPDDWQCWLLAGEGPEHGSRLYLQHAEHGSWSFHAHLDRKQPALVADHPHEASGARTATVAARSLRALIPGLRKAQGAALRRAARAICARVGATQP